MLKMAKLTPFKNPLLILKPCQQFVKFCKHTSTTQNRNICFAVMNLKLVKTFNFLFVVYLSARVIFVTLGTVRCQAKQNSLVVW